MALRLIVISTIVESGAAHRLRLDTNCEIRLIWSGSSGASTGLTIFTDPVQWAFPKCEFDSPDRRIFACRYFGNVPEEV
jgi:hypothetical protein